MFDNEAMVLYACNDDLWISYEDAQSATEKAKLSQDAQVWQSYDIQFELRMTLMDAVISLRRRVLLEELMMKKAAQTTTIWMRGEETEIINS